MEDGSKKTRAQIDFDDLQNEISGRDVGRISRFLSKEALEAIKNIKGPTGEQHFNLLDLLLLSDPEYATLYIEVWDTLDNTQNAIDQTLEDIEERLEKAEQNLSEIKDKAPELSDGTEVFRSEDRKNAYTEHERKLSEAEMSTVEWKEDSPDWEQYLASKNERDQVLRDKREVEDYQDAVLNPAREKLNDKDSPPSKEEMKEILRDIKNRKPRILRETSGYEPVQNEISSKISAAHSYVADTAMSVPSMNEQFNAARLDIPDIDTAPDLEKSPTPDNSPKIIP